MAPLAAPAVLKTQQACVFKKASAWWLKESTRTAGSMLAFGGSERLILQAGAACGTPAAHSTLTGGTAACPHSHVSVCVPHNKEQTSVSHTVVFGAEAADSPLGRRMRA